jgi:hypothetical protein
MACATLSAGGAISEIADHAGGDRPRRRDRGDKTVIAVFIAGCVWFLPSRADRHPEASVIG